MPNPTSSWTGSVEISAHPDNRAAGADRIAGEFHDPALGAWVAASATAGMIGFADHLGRCLHSAELAGVTATVPQGFVAPDVYDVESDHPWTRNRIAYLTIVVPARMFRIDAPD